MRVLRLVFPGVIAINASKMTLNKCKLELSEVIHYPVLYFLHQLPSSFELSIGNLVFLLFNRSWCNVCFVDSVLLQNNSLNLWFRFSLLHLFLSFLLFFSSDSLTLFHQAPLSILLRLFRLFLLNNWRILNNRLLFDDNLSLWLLYKRLLFLFMLLVYTFNRRQRFHRLDIASVSSRYWHWYLNSCGCSNFSWFWLLFNIDRFVWSRFRIILSGNRLRRLYFFLGSFLFQFFYHSRLFSFNFWHLKSFPQLFFLFLLYFLLSLFFCEDRLFHR